MPSKQEIETMLKNEFALTNISFTEHPIVKIRKNINYSENQLFKLAEINSLESNFYHTLVLLIDVRIITDKNKRQMAFITFSDETIMTKGVVFFFFYAKIKGVLEKNAYLVLTVKTDKNNSGKFVIANAKKVNI